MKNRIIVLVSILVLLVLAFSSCHTEEKHTHSFSSDFSTDEVYHWYACQCGEKNGYEQHAWNSGVVTLKPTTESEGERTFTCSVCRSQKVEKIDKLTAEHTHIYDIIGSDENYHWNECVCGEKEAQSEHSFDGGVITTHPTVDSEGVKTYTCSVCKYEKTEKIDKLDPDHTHSFGIEANDEHAHWNECVCGSKENVTAHNWNGGEVTTPATETEAGIKTYTCNDCGRKMTEIISAVANNGMSFMRSAHHKITGRLEKTPLTLEAEIKVPKTVNRAGAIFSNYLGIELRQIWHFEIYDGGVPRFYYVDKSGNSREIKFDGIDVRTGEWMHIAFTFDYENGAISLYIDGELAKTVACEYDIAPDATRYEFTFGGDNRSNNGLYFQGQIRSLSVYSDVRSGDEIKASYENGANLYADDIILAYLLNKNCEGNEIIDLTGNDNNVPKEWLDSHEPTIDYAYSFAVVGDTQWMSKYTPEKMEGIYDWIVANKDDKKIAHVFGLGDITEDWNTADKEQEWIRAYEYISKLNGVVPYSLVRGNHDESKYFFKYFDNDTYKNQFDGFMGGDDITNSYMLVTIGSTDYLFMTLDYGASDEMLEWASDIVLAYPERRVIITTHGYMGFDETPLSSDNVTPSGDIHSGSDVDTSVGNNIRGYNNGKAIWEKFVSKHPNIFLLLSGHTSFEDIILYRSEGDHGNVVNQMCIDPQWMDPQKGGVGMVCMLYFSEDGTQMEVEWLSTDTGKYYKEQNQFVLDLTDSLNAPAHSFETSYNENYHYKACDCGYIYGEQPHVFDGGVLNADGFITYTCECGYQKITSATNDPVAKELQQLLDSFYNGGVYYKETLVNSNPTLIFYNGDKFFVAGSSENLATADYLTLKDIILGKYGDKKLDLGWNYFDGVYSSANADTVNGIASFVMTSEDNSATRVTVEVDGEQLVIKLYAGDSLMADCKIGSYVTTTLVDASGDVLDYLYTKADKNGICEIYTPAISGYVCEYDKIIVDTRHSSLARTAYYSTVSVWDGVSVSTSLKGEGTESNPYLVESGADLAYIAGEVNKVAAKASAFSGKYFKLTQSIDLNGHELFIGGSSEWGTRQIFAGYFDGNHCTIRGLKNTRSLFAAVEGGWLKNLSVYGIVSGAGTVGGIVGYVANGGVLENLTSYVTVNGVNTLGGIVANAENQSSTVINCVNYGNVTGSSWNVGGIAGSGGHDIIGCVNFGNVHSTGSDNIGGIAGTTKNTGSISDCYNYGNISSVHGRVGGIVGWLNKLVVNCVNYGSINAGWDSGGVVGYVNDGQSATIKDCINNGKVTGNTGIGGVFGFNHANAGSILITGCVNNGEVGGTWGVGGIAGNTKAEISNCINNGVITASGELGGIVGKCYGKVTECTNRGEVKGAQDIIGGIVGHLHDTTYGKVISTTNYQEGTVSGPNAQQIIGKGYVYVEEPPVEEGPITEEEFKAQPAMFGSPWVSNNTRMKILVKIRMEKGTKITFLGDTSVYCWGIMETTDKDNASQGAWKDSGWNTSWANPNENTYVTTYATGYFVITVGKLDASGKPTIALTQAELDNIHSMFKVEGNKAGENEGGSVNNPTLNDSMVSINHRGWYEAPENTLSAYRESYNQGFKYVECDVQFTKDGIPVLLHDDTIDRTSNGSGTLSQMTYAQVSQYDFSYDDADSSQDFSKYRGEKIPTFEEFIALCKELSLHPYIEIKGNLTDEEAAKLVKIVSDAGMLDDVSWLGFSGDALAKIVNVDPTARLVWVLTDTYDSKIAQNNIPFAEANLMTGESEVVFDLYYTLVTDSIVELLKSKNIPLEVWTINDTNAILNLHPYVSGVTSDKYNAKEILTEAGKI